MVLLYALDQESPTFAWSQESQDGVLARPCHTFMVKWTVGPNPITEPLYKPSVMLLLSGVNHQSGANHQFNLKSNPGKVAQNMLILALDPWLQNSTVSHYTSLTIGQYRADTSHTPAKYLRKFQAF